MKWATVFLIGVTVALVTGGGYIVAEYIAQRGIRNNNPGNIRHGDNWQGMSDTQTDSAFIQFITPEYGIRAAAKILLTYSDKYGLNTVQGIISRWAPPVENDTQSYIRSVAARLGVAPSTPLDVRERMPELLDAIIYHENGVQPYDFITVANGIRLAGVSVSGSAFA